MLVSRRAVIAGGGLAALACAAPASAVSLDADRQLRAMLDAAAAGADMLRPLQRFKSGALSPSARLDLVTARAGLRIDAELARRFPDPKGAMTPARYALLLKRLTGDDTKPERAQHRLERELHGLLARANALLTQQGHHDGPVGARFSALWRDPRWLYPDDDAGRDQAVADMNRVLARARDGIRQAFPDIPPYCLNVAVRRMSRTDEAAGRGGYRELPGTGRPGAYIVDLKDISRRPSWTLPSVVHHELLPGHMIQLPIEALADPHPLRLKYAPGFAEGWAIRGEQLAASQGAYAGDAMGELGHLHWLLFRVGRALIDLHLHLSGWTIERARAQLVEWQGEPAYFAPFDMDLKRIAAEPALRVAEALAWLTIADLARADQRGVHRVALAHGRMRNDELRRTMRHEGGWR
jgi:hypothetical protein